MVISFPAVGASLPPTQAMEHDAVRASQHIYRVLLDAISHPGQVWKLISHPHIAIERNLPYPWLASVLMALVDHEVSLHVVPAPSIDVMQEALARRTRVKSTALTRADFVAADARHFSPQLLLDMNAGSLDYPDDGATIVLQVESLVANHGAMLTFTGPGINGEISRAGGDLTPELLNTRNRVVRDYPLGIDMFIVDRNGQVMAIPRTTTIAIQEGGN